MNNFYEELNKLINDEEYQKKDMEKRRKAIDECLIWLGNEKSKQIDTKIFNTCYDDDQIEIFEYVTEQIKIDPNKMYKVIVTVEEV